MNIHFEELAENQRTGGIEVATRELTTHLKAAGWEVTRSSKQSPLSKLPDCVHLHGIWSPKLAAQFMRWNKLGVPCVVSPHGMLDPWALSHKWLKKKVAWHAYQKRLLDQAAFLHGTSERETKQFKALKIKAIDALVPWGVSLPPETKPHTSRHRPRIALFVGRIYPVKGLLMLVEAWARVRPSGWKLRIVGPDEAGHQTEIEALIAKARTRDEFEFAGPLHGKALRDAYDSADLFILPSYTESFGMAVAEAMAHSLPVITTTGTPWHILPERQCGWWVPPHPDQLAETLATATALDADTLRDMGERGRQLVADEFNWQQTAVKMTQLYQWALSVSPSTGNASREMMPAWAPISPAAQRSGCSHSTL